MKKDSIYLDYNATAPVRPEAKAALTQALMAPHNPSSVHLYGREARRMIEEARVSVSALVGTQPAQVIFNSGATEGNNTVLRHFSGERILVSAIEHPAVLEVCPEAERISVTPAGVIDLDALEALLKKGPRTGLVSVMLANNETGVIQPLVEVSAMAKRYGALMHCDAVQGPGRIPVNIGALGIDFMTLSAHKMGGPQGAGALVLGLCGITPTLLSGGGQEKKARPGTENVAAICGFGSAAQAILETPHENERYGIWQDKLETGLKACADDIVIHGEESVRIPNTTLFSVPGVKAETMLMALDLEGVAVSNGSACTSGTVKVSHVLRAMGCSDDLATSALRISTGWATTEADIDRALEVWSKVYHRILNKRKRTDYA